MKIPPLPLHSHTCFSPVSNCWPSLICSVISIMTYMSYICCTDYIHCMSLLDWLFFTQHRTLHHSDGCVCQLYAVVWICHGLFNSLSRSTWLLLVCSVAQSCPTLCDPGDCSPPGSSVHGISQARILEWLAISSSRGSSWSRDWTHVSCIGQRILYHWTFWESMHTWAHEQSHADLYAYLKYHFSGISACEYSLWVVWLVVACLIL